MSYWLRLIVGIVVAVIGVVAFAWPEATLRVVAFLFGLNLLVMGVSRTVLAIIAREAPALQRVLAGAFGVLVTLVGVLCVRNPTGSLSLLLLIIAIGWILDGLGEIVVTFGRHEPGGGWRIALGVFVLLAAIAILVWPGLSLATFLLIGATTLVFAGICLVVGAIAGLRSSRAAA
ncbi:uncharacterized membrane protein HdeD (DUF308 family) [Actinoplanes campanulatus]|uniref:Uncharacterized membrane protein HdeD (DUF308 family) n=1 Tax=Actinoplanes campanulatus TaxID=113559 RepID=A0A7W5ADS1_9ACTN|nr:DUF308 domain-containing protein [Actinoplanes campanulatus]MBB3094472.1 uncharacterized membrane protein HdeD (DUF308 family) [Actinoplanes campanulatus]GGN21282.1 hypothetical protein GCM10010109_35350 [Actinoplanes campanulatus]GID35615.1 hypothetical protein Aca09nite_21210 [Actinoplanes campanulatus]